MTYVVRREGESIDQLTRRFNRAVDAAGVLREFTSRVRFKTEAEQRRQKSRDAQRRRGRSERRLREQEALAERRGY